MAQRSAVVVGGGIGGLAAAVALHQRGWRVEVLERAAGLTEIGAGLSLWPNALRALDCLGLGEQVCALGRVEKDGGLRDRKGRWLLRTDNAGIERRHGRPLVVICRADLVSVLAAALPPRALRLGSRVEAVRTDGDIAIVEHGQGVSRAELVVAADGVRSSVRRQWWPGEGVPRYVGYAAWRMICEPFEGGPDGAVFCGRGERIGYTALPGGRAYCFAAVTVPAGVASPGGEHAALLRRFGNWPYPIPALLAATPADRVLRHDVYDLPALSCYVREQIALLGDAAHAMDPILGQGGCQALEDAVTLAACLDTTPHLKAALVSYDRLRRPRAQAIAARSARIGGIAQWAWPPAARLRNLAARLVPASVALKAMDTVLDWAPPAGQNQAVR
jgi:2-polyprenyl-6-methoxyphenol hydroxylase-like FAD-dependent oxidoreductase